MCPDSFFVGKTVAVTCMNWITSNSPSPTNLKKTKPHQTENKVVEQAATAGWKIISITDAKSYCRWSSVTIYKYLNSMMPQCRSGNYTTPCWTFPCSNLCCFWVAQMRSLLLITVIAFFPIFWPFPLSH